MIEMGIPLQYDSEVIFDFVFIGSIIMVVVGDYGVFANEVVFSEERFQFYFA